MRISLNTSKWYDNVWAAFIFFTRLPFWRLYQPPKESYKTVVEHWPLTGWLTGAVMAATLYFGSMVFPFEIAVAMAMAVRILLTGALHEDGLCDFFDGFGGGGTDRERVLAIMKDSRIGTYGVLGIVLYELFVFLCLTSLSPTLAALTVLVADPYAKMLAGQMIMTMPYARTEAESKAKTVYRRMPLSASVSLAVQGLLPLGLYLWFVMPQGWQTVVFAPCFAMYLIYLLIWRRLRGYTGDCCGAMFLLVELSVYLAVVFVATNAQ